MENKNYTDLIWRKSKKIQDSVFPVSRVGFCLGYSEYLDGILMFGGRSSDRLNDTLLFKPAENKWVELKTTGKPPSERCFAASFIKDKLLFVFGGYGEKDKSYNDIHILFLDFLTWRNIFLVDSPDPRHLSSICSEIIKINSFYFGQEENAETRKLRKLKIDVFRQTNFQKQMNKRESILKVSKSRCSLTNNFSPSLSINSNFNDKRKNSVYLFGGVGMPSDVFFNDLWELDLTEANFTGLTNELKGVFWTRIPTSGEVL